MLIDTHAHLEMREFDEDREDVIKRAKDAGVEYIVTIGTTVESSRDAVLLAEKHDCVYAAVGIHPHEAKDILHPAYEVVRRFATHKKVVAYGEIGLDYYYEHTQRSVQLRKLRDMLHEARELKLPIIVHDRDAHEDALRILQEAWDPALGGVIHCFSGDIEYAKKVMDLASEKASQHNVQRGDTLFSIARSYGVSVAQLTEANPDVDSGLKAGQVIRLPASELTRERSTQVAVTPRANKSDKPVRYTVKRGDTLHGIAQRFDISLNDLKAWNPDFRKKSAVRAGQTIAIK